MGPYPRRMFNRRTTNTVRIDWDGYVRGQLAWWVALSELARDTSRNDTLYLNQKAQKALQNARHPANPLAR